MTNRTITGKILFHDGEPWANAKLTFTLLTDTAARPGEALPVWSKVYYTLANGDLPAGVTLEVPPTGAFLYRLKVEENAPIDFYLQAGAALTVDEVVALGGQPGTDGTPEWAFVVQIYAALQDADAGQVLTADGAGGATWEDASGGVEEAPDDGGLYGRQSEDWTELGSAALLDAGTAGAAVVEAETEAAVRAAIGALPLDASVTAARTTGYTFQSSDRGAVIPVSGTFTFSLPDGMPVGAQALLVRTGAGTVTLAAATTLVSDGTQLSENGAAATVLHLGSNVWYAFGKLS